MIRFRKYGTLLVTGTTAISIPLIKRGVVDYAVAADWTPVAGDVKVWLDGTAANITNLPTAINSGNSTHWEFILTAAELSGKQVKVEIVDSATKAVEDDMFIIETFGHASAMYPVDFSLASYPATIAAGAIATDAIDGASVKADAVTKIQAGLPTSVEMDAYFATVASDGDATAADVTIIKKIVQGDHYIDIASTPWALVTMEAGTGGIGVGTELLRKKLKDINGADVTDTATVLGQDHQ